MNSEFTSKHDPFLLVMCGPTAVGKTELALQVAELFSCEIIGVDSMQIYRYMDIGTAKPTAADRSRVPHYLIDIVDPDQDYTLGRFVKDADAAIQAIHSHNKIPLLAGGTGLYFKGLLEGVFDELAGSGDEAETDEKRRSSIKKDLRNRLASEGKTKLHNELAEVDPTSAQRIHPNDSHRILRGLEIYYTTGLTWSEHLARQPEKNQRYRALKIGLTRARKELYNRIDQRVQQMADLGLLSEVEKLLAMGFDKKIKSMQSIGYRHMINYIDGKWNWQEALDLLARDTRNYAKRQFTWFNNDPEIIWYDVSETENILAAVKDFIIKNNP